MKLFLEGIGNLPAACIWRASNVAIDWRASAWLPVAAGEDEIVFTGAE